MTQHYDLLGDDGDRNRRNVDLILGAVEALISATDLGATVRSAVDGAVQVTGAARGFLLRPDAAGQPVVSVSRDRAGRDLPADARHSRSLVSKVWTTRKPVLTLEPDSRDGGASLSRSIVDLRLMSVLAVPLLVKDRLIGVLYVDSTMRTKEFTKQDQIVFETLAGLVAAAIENAALAAAEAERARMANEMALARDIQQGLLPKDPKPPPGFDLAAVGLPCDETSGDYYDVIPTADGRVALVAGDVQGHGMPAALYMASVRAALRTLLHTSHDPAEVFASLNAFLCRDMPNEKFVSLFLGFLDPRTAVLEYASAGHCPPYVRRRGMPLLALERTGPVLGVMEGFRYKTAPPVPLKPDDALVLYTDGIYEAMNASKEMYGEERFQDSIERHGSRDGSAASILDGLLKDLDAFVAGRRREDDVTCLVLRVAAGGGTPR